MTSRVTFLQITTACNARCLMCDMWKKPVQYMPFSSIIKLFDSIARDIPNSEIRLTGGEPCLHPQFEKIIYEGKNRNLSISVITNSSLLNNFLPICDHIDFVFLSIDSPYEKDQFNIRGLKINQTFYKNLNIIANIVVSKLNINSIKEIPIWLKKNGIGTINLIPMKKRLYMLPASELEKLFIQILSICTSLDIYHFYEASPIKQTNSQNAIRAIEQRKSVSICHIQQLIDFIDIYGQLFHCNSTPHRNGSPTILKNELCCYCQAYLSSFCDLSNLIYNIFKNEEVIHENYL
jgi:MoaA/NifB/PqqE/SkfB family radical SAM enzyme